MVADKKSSMYLQNLLCWFQCRRQVLQTIKTSEDEGAEFLTLPNDVKNLIDLENKTER